MKIEVERRQGTSVLTTTKGLHTQTWDLPRAQRPTRPRLLALKRAKLLLHQRPDLLVLLLPAHAAQRAHLVLHLPDLDHRRHVELLRLLQRQRRRAPADRLVRGEQPHRARVPQVVRVRDDDLLHRPGVVADVLDGEHADLGHVPFLGEREDRGPPFEGGDVGPIEVSVNRIWN